MISKTTAKQRATQLREILADLGHTLNHAHALETVARQNGYRDWNTCSAALERSADLLPPPTGWTAGGDRREHYEIGLDASQTVNGAHPAVIRYRETAPKDGTGFATFVQTFDAVKYCGHRVRFSTELKAVDCDGAVTLWFRADSASRQAVAFDNLEANGVGHDNGPITGTTDWSARTIVLDVPDDAVKVSMGFYLRGTGAGYVNGFALNLVSHDVPVTVGAHLSTGDPVNLSLKT
ncbi:MAG: glyoxalase superfamily protein [Planktomarina sp.]